ncbi:MAG: XRE family transcriptional regulator [Helicobacteraceae bacterium]|nr:XRE family transcriptional regulator [Helicobacteraceae bacterium]
MNAIMENIVFSGKKTLLGNRLVQMNDQDLDPRHDLFNHARDGYDWGYIGAGPLQLAFAILVKMTNPQFATKYRAQFNKEVVAKLDQKNWTLDAHALQEWIDNKEKHELEVTPTINSTKGKSKKELNVVKEACKKLGITQKKLSQILEIPEGTVSSWAVKNEIPRLGKKAIQFYTQNQQNQEIVSKFKDLLTLVNHPIK